MAITEKYASSAGAGANDGSSEANAWSWATMLTAAAAGDRVNFKGAHTLTSSAVFTNAGTATSPIIVRGYNSTIGDCSALGRTNGNGPLVTTGMPDIDCSTYTITLPAWGVAEALDLTGASSTNVIALGAQGAIIRCRVVHTGTGTNANALSLASNYTTAFDCDAAMTGASGGLAAISLSGTSARVVACRADGGNTCGIRLNAATVYAIACTAYSAATDAILLVGTANGGGILYCTLVTATSDGIHVPTGPTQMTCVIGNLITDNGAYGVYSVDAAAGILALGNRYDRNTSGASSGATDWLSAFAGFNNTTSATQANEFVGAGSDDYRLKNTSPAVSAGVPAYADIGALQRVTDYPAVGNVHSDDTTDGASGTLTLPTAGQVETGVQYGAGGTEFTGTLTASGAGAWAHRTIGGGF